LLKRATDELRRVVVALEALSAKATADALR
jgi:hypothetical protein